MAEYIFKKEGALMKKKVLLPVALLTLAIAATIPATYITETASYPLSTLSKSNTATPVLDPVYVESNYNWHGNFLSVNATSMPIKAQQVLAKNVQTLAYPIKFTTSDKAVQFKVTDLKDDMHALTTNGGNTILMDKQFVAKNLTHPNALGKTMTHELGHSLGLLHTDTASIMYPSKGTYQTLTLNDAQKTYINHVSNVSLATRVVARIVSPVWTAQAVNHFDRNTVLPESHLVLRADKGLLSQSAISTWIMVANIGSFIAILAIFALIASVIRFKYDDYVKTHQSH